MSKQPSNLDYVCMSNDEYLRERLRQMDITLQGISNILGRIEGMLNHRQYKRIFALLDKSPFESKNNPQTHAS